MGGTAVSLILLIGLLSMHCAQQGYLEEAYLCFLAKILTDHFFSASIEPTLIHFSPLMRFSRQVLMTILIDNIIFPTTISFYFDLSLFSSMHICILFYSICQTFSRLYYGVRGIRADGTIMHYRIRGIWKYPFSGEAMVIPLFFHVYGCPCPHIKVTLCTIMCFLNIINLPFIPSVFSYCFSPHTAQLIFHEEEFTNQRQFPLYSFISKSINKVIRKIWCRH